jgi:hypothetical protein
MSVTVNKQELAAWLGVHLTTLAQWMLKYGADFPVIERGTNGRDYRFDAQAVSDFLRAKQEEQAASKAQRDERLAQLRLPFDLPGVEPPPKATSTKEELLAWELRKRQRQEAEAAGLLVPAAPALEAFSTAFARISRDTRAFVRQLGIEQHWPVAYIRAVEKRLVENQAASVAAVRELLGTSVPLEEAAGSLPPSGK